MPSPLISVLINNYNYGHFLSAAIDSVLSQTYSNVEIIVVDDGSTDDSLAVIRRYGDAVIPVLKANGGQDSAFNAGFAQSHGEIACFLDADDKFTPDKLAKVATCVSQNPQIGWCFHALLLQDPNTGQSLGKTRAFPNAEQDRSTPCDFRQALRWGRLPFYPMSTSGLCFRRSLLAQILPMPETFLNASADRYLRSAAMALTSGYFLSDRLTIQGIHGNNTATLHAERPFQLESQLVTAYLLKTCFPRLRLYANRLFARGLCAYQALKNETDEAVEPEYEQLIKDYYHLCSPLDRAIIALIRKYHSRAQRQEYSFRPPTEIPGPPKPSLAGLAQSPGLPGYQTVEPGKGRLE